MRLGSREEAAGFGMQIKSSKEGENVKIIYEIMHGEEKTARVDTQGIVKYMIL